VLLRRLLSPVGLLFVAICCVLPLAARSCDSPATGRSSISDSGDDLVTRGQAHLEVSDGYPDTLPPAVPVQSLVLAALVCAAAGIVVAVLRRPAAFALAGTATALLTVIGLGGGEIIVLRPIRRQQRDSPRTCSAARRMASPNVQVDVHPRYGIWLALVLSVALVAGNGRALVRLSRSDQQPEQDSTEPVNSSG
jgi:hypothetical protein